MSEEHDERLIARAREAVERDAEGLDPATRGRLAAARRAALDELERPALAWRGGWAPVGAAAAVAVAAVGVALSLRAPAPGADPGAARALELEVLLGEDDPALYEDDLEFYAWLEEQAAAERDAG